MKKFLAIVAVLAIVLTMSVSAFATAEGPSPTEYPLTVPGLNGVEKFGYDADKFVSAQLGEAAENGAIPFAGIAGSSGASPAGSNGAASTPAGSSPQTGFDGTVWMIAMGGLLLAAGVCFVCARKDHE